MPRLSPHCHREIMECHLHAAKSGEQPTEETLIAILIDNQYKILYKAIEGTWLAHCTFTDRHPLFIPDKKFKACPAGCYFAPGVLEENIAICITEKKEIHSPCYNIEEVYTGATRHLPGGPAGVKYTDMDFKKKNIEKLLPELFPPCPKPTPLKPIKA